MEVCAYHLKGMANDVKGVKKISMIMANDAKGVKTTIVVMPLRCAGRCWLVGITPGKSPERSVAPGTSEGQTAFH